MANVIYNAYKLGLVTGDTKIENGSTTIYVGLTSAYTPSEEDTAVTIVASELTSGASGYSRVNLTNVTIATSSVAGEVNDYVKFDADDASWNPATFTASGAFVFSSSAVNGGDVGDETDVKPICWVDFNGDKTASAGEFKIIWSTNGIIQYKQQ